VALLIGCAVGSLPAHPLGAVPSNLEGQAAPGTQPGRGGGAGRGGTGAAIFLATDANKDGTVTRDEFRGAFEQWFSEWDLAKSGSLTATQIGEGLAGVIAANTTAPPAPQPDACGGRSNNPRVACQGDVDKMLAALPAKAIAKPARPRRVLVLASTRGFVHSSIPLAAKMIEEMGQKTGAWTATTTYDAADINSANLKQYDAIVLDSTTGCFLDDPGDAAATAARRAALLEFIRGGKGIAGLHAASDSYHGSSCSEGGAPAGLPPGARGAQGGGRGRGGAATPYVAVLFVQGDKDADQKLSRAEFTAAVDGWYDTLDRDKTGRVAQADFGPRFAGLLPPPPPGGGRQNAGATPQRPGGDPLWPEWNTIIGGYFKFHWNDPQLITVKIDDPTSPLTAMFKGQAWEIRDETYTFNQESFSRDNVRVLTSVDYDKMSAEDKAKEPNPRSDHDYALSWVRREGRGRLFYEAHGHHERNYAITPFLEHILAGVQYAIGDLKADDTPVKSGNK
jgi:type 1 glutamine amidotransferase